MFTRILTEFERKQIRAYLKRDGTKDVVIRMLVSRYRRDKQTIFDDIELLDRLVSTYEKHLR
jgi:hypothetical protein